MLKFPTFFRVIFQRGSVKECVDTRPHIVSGRPSFRPSSAAFNQARPIWPSHIHMLIARVCCTYWVSLFYSQLASRQAGSSGRLIGQLAVAAVSSRAPAPSCVALLVGTIWLIRCVPAIVHCCQNVPKGIFIRPFDGLSTSYIQPLIILLAYILILNYLV